MTPKEAQQLLDDAKKHRFDIPQILSDVHRLKQMVMEGIVQEKCNVRDDSGISEFTERYPSIYLEACKFQHKIYWDLMKLSQDASVETEISFSVNVLPLTLPDADVA